jgi:hypothetical protein
MRLSIFWLTVIAAQSVFGSPAPGNGAGDIIGKVIAGYQGWFSCGQDKTDPNDDWTHWGNGTVQDITFELWPNVSEYTNTYQWNYDAILGNGQAADLFDSYDSQTVQLHFDWMKQYDIDVAAVQRFGTNLLNEISKEHMDGVFYKVRENAERTGRKFYTMWDISGWTNFTTELPQDWENFAKDLISSPAYAKQNGKPVVCVWGIGVLGRPGTHA